MDKSLIFMFVKLMLVLIVIMLLAVITIRASSKKLNIVSQDKYVKILEKTQISKDTFIYVVKIGEEGCVMTSSNGNTSKLQDLSKEEMKKIEKNKEEYNKKLTLMYDKSLNKAKGFIKNVDVKNLIRRK